MSSLVWIFLFETQLNFIDRFILFFFFCNSWNMFIFLIKINFSIKLIKINLNLALVFIFLLLGYYFIYIISNFNFFLSYSLAWYLNDSHNWIFRIVKEKNDSFFKIFFKGIQLSPIYLIILDIYLYKFILYYQSLEAYNIWWEVPIKNLVFISEKWSEISFVRALNYWALLYIRQSI